MNPSPGFLFENLCFPNQIKYVNRCWCGYAADGYIGKQCSEAKKVITHCFAIDNSLIRNAAVNGGAFCTSSGWKVVDVL